MKKSHYLLSLLVFNLASNFAVADTANNHCTNLSLNGTYTFNAQGLKADSSHDPFSYIGMVYFNGKGGGQAKWYTSGSGASAANIDSYKVAENCHAVVNYSNGKVFDYFVSPNGNSAHWTINKPNNLSVSSEVKRISKSNLLLKQDLPL